MTERAIGWGKIILLGEHAVVYGYPALAAALDRGVSVACVPTRPRRNVDMPTSEITGTLRIDVPAWSLAVAADDEHPVGRGLARIADTLGIGRPSLSLVGDAQIPAGAGLGSSAALAVAVTRALSAHHKLATDIASITRAANASEMELHGRASGVDVAVAAAGGIGVFRKSGGLAPMRVPALRVLVGPSGAPRSTAQMVEHVAEVTRSGQDATALRELGDLTDTGAAALAAKDYAKLGAAMNRAHAVLRELGVSTEQLDSLCEGARAAGAYGAKLTGAGGGGAVIAIAPRESESAVLALWKDVGVTGFVATIGS
jgi:mevalonate kinase